MSKLREAVIVSAVRTPIGKYGGVLAGLDGYELGGLWYVGYFLAILGSQATELLAICPRFWFCTHHLRTLLASNYMVWAPSCHNDWRFL